MKKLLIVYLALLVASVALAQRFPPGPLVSSKKAEAGGPTPIAWWKLNDGSGTSATDASGNSNTGTLTGGTTWGTGPNSNGDAVFDGVDDRIDIANESNFDFERTSAFSVSAWVKANSADTGVGTIWSKLQQTGNQPGITINWSSDNGWIQVYVIQADGNLIAVNGSAASVSLNTWYHVVLTYDGSSNGTGLKLYLNGSSYATGSGTLSQSILNNTAALIGYGSGYFYGDIDDVRVYNVELTSGQVSSLYSGGAQ